MNEFHPQPRLYQWLIAQINRTGWSYRTISERGGVSKTTISDFLNGKVTVSADTCIGLARAFDTPVENVFEYAGIFTNTTIETRNKREAAHLLSLMTDEEQESYLRYGRFIIDERTGRSGT